MTYRKIVSDVAVMMDFMGSMFDKRKFDHLLIEGVLRYCAGRLAQQDYDNIKAGLGHKGQQMHSIAEMNDAIFRQEYVYQLSRKFDLALDIDVIAPALWTKKGEI